MDGTSTPELVVVTGASGGIGAALAARLARPGRTIALVGRSEAGLAEAAARVRSAGGEALPARLNLASEDFGAWLEEAAAGRRLVALYANAGLSAGPPSPAELETAADTERLVRLNLLGTIATVRAAAALMRGTGGRGIGGRGAEGRAADGRAAEGRDGSGRAAGGRIGIVSSVAGLLPTPDLAVYSATKAALIAYAHAIRPRLAADGVAVTVVCPGFVTSPMSARHIGAKPFEMSPDAAARRIVRAVEAGRRTAVFPLPFALLATFAPLAPGALIDALVPGFKATIVPDERDADPPSS
jgi:short-subunit dehydrogenase